MITREVIVTSPAGVRLAFEATGEKGLAVVAGDFSAESLTVHDLENGKIVGIVPTSWLVELNENVT